MSCLSTDFDKPSQHKPPSSILIVGAGVFGLSTSLAILLSPTYAQTHLTLIDPDLPSTDDKTAGQGFSYRPSPHAASIDSSRIIRPDYANPAYSKLAAEAQEAWRQGFGGEDVYHESGLVVVAGNSGNKYVEAACQNVEEPCDEDGAISPVASRPRAEENVKRLANTEEIRAAAGLPKTDSPDGKIPEASEQVGSTGYMNYTSGWANAEGAMQTMMKRLLAHNSSNERLTLKRAHVQSLLFSASSSSQSTNIKDNDISNPKPAVTGVLLSDSSELHSPLTILATGAHTPSLLDLRGHIRATGQEIAYVPLTSFEAQELRNMPVLLNLSTGYFVIPPARNASSPHSIPTNPRTSASTSQSQHQNQPQNHNKAEEKRKENHDEPNYTHHLKLARHSHGHTNPTPVTLSLGGSTTTTTLIPSLPTSLSSLGGSHQTKLLSPLRTFLTSLFPTNHPLHNRPFSSTRLCWYTDTPTGDFLVTYHPNYEGLFLATGGSGHAFKFLPVLGGRVVGVLEGRGGEWERVWGWREGVEEGEWRGDGSRGGGGEG